MLWIFTIMMLIVYCFYVWLGFTGNIMWMQSFSESVRYHGYEWKNIGTIFYLFFFLGAFFINRRLVEKFMNTKSRILFIIPIILLWGIEIVRLFNIT